MNKNKFLKIQSLKMETKEKIFLRKIIDCSLEVQLQVREIRIQKIVNSGVRFDLLFHQFL